MFLAAGGMALLALPQVALAAGTTTTSGSSILTGPVSGTLTGSSSGAFATYEFNYPGNSSPVTFVLTVDQANALRGFTGITQQIYHTPSSAAGVNIYQNGVLMVTSTQSSANTATAVFSSAIGGPVTVQVYDYYTPTPINFNLTPTGLPAQAATTTTTSVTSTATSSTSSPPVTTSTATSTTSGTLTGPVSGNLVGSSSGAFATYTFTYPGNSSPVTFVLTVDQANALRGFTGETQRIYHTPSSSAGVNVYQNGLLMVTSSQSTPNTATAIFSSSIAGPVTVQVYDFYTPAPINFNLTPTGLP
jgi:hypothetical protein